MNDKEKYGISYLQSQTYAVITAMLGLIFNTQSKAQSLPQTTEGLDHTMNSEEFQKRVLKPKLVLKLNLANPDNSLLAISSLP